MDKENSPYRALSPLRKIWDKENLSPQHSPLKHTAVDLEKYKIDAALLALCSPNAEENLHRLSLCSPKRASPSKSSPNKQASSPVSLSSPNKRARKMSSPVSAKMARQHKKSPRTLTASYTSFNEDKTQHAEKKNTAVRAVSQQDEPDKTIQDISHSIKRTVSLIDDLNKTVNGLF